MASEPNPDTPALNADGTLKDASEIEWLNSPSDKPKLLPSLSSEDEAKDADVQDQEPSSNGEAEVGRGKRKRTVRVHNDEIKSLKEKEDTAKENLSDGDDAPKKKANKVPTVQTTLTRNPAAKSSKSKKRCCTKETAKAVVPPVDAPEVAANNAPATPATTNRVATNVTALTSAKRKTDTTLDVTASFEEVSEVVNRGWIRLGAECRYCWSVSQAQTRNAPVVQFKNRRTEFER
jgi:hypothetical protein